MKKTIPWSIRSRIKLYRLSLTEKERQSFAVRVVYMETQIHRSQTREVQIVRFHSDDEAHAQSLA